MFPVDSGIVISYGSTNPRTTMGCRLVNRADFEDLFFSSLSGGDAPLLVFSASPVPEPGTASLLAAAFLGAGGFGLLRACGVARENGCVSIRS